jgi:iron complex outermembrane receptor protein
LYWARASSTVRTADATERYVGASHNLAMMRWVGNPNIQPETHNQVELGAKWRFDNGWTELNTYYDKVNDFILRDRARMQTNIAAIDMATIYHNVNASLYGFEWALQKEFADTWVFHTNLAYVKGTNDSTDRPLYQIPPVEGLIQFSNEKNDIAYWVDVRFALNQNDVDDNRMIGSGLDAGKSDSWSIVDFKLRYDLNSNWQLSAGLNNVFDETYSYHVSRANADPFNPEPIRVNEPGRQIWVSVLTEL